MCEKVENRVTGRDCRHLDRNDVNEETDKPLSSDDRPRTATALGQTIHIWAFLPGNPQTQQHQKGHYCCKSSMEVPKHGQNSPTQTTQIWAFLQKH